MGISALLKDTLVSGRMVGVSALSPPIRVTNPASLRLLFPNKLRRHTASLFDESLGTKRPNLISFHLSASLFFSLSIFPQVFSQHEIIGTAQHPVGTSSFIFSHINTQSHWASPLSTQKSLPLLRLLCLLLLFPEKLPFDLAVSSWPPTLRALEKYLNIFSHNSLLPRAFWDHSQQVAAPGGPIAHHGSLLFFTLKKKRLPDGLL